MEKNFLLYLIYISLIEIRERSHENGDKVSYGLCNLLHNIPPALISDETGKKAYDNFIQKIEQWEMNNWLELRKKEFYDRYPEYKTDEL